MALGCLVTAERQPPDATVAPCPGCGYRRLVVHDKHGTVRVRTHDMRQPKGTMAGLSAPRLGVCPGSRTVVDVWVPA